MIDEIKKYVDKYCRDEDGTIWNEDVCEILDILDKYNNQEYKSAWEELKTIIEEDKTPRLANLLSQDSRANIEFKMQELEQKYNLVSIVERVDE